VKVNSGGIHVMYKELYDSMIGCKPGEPGSHTETVWRTTEDVFDAVMSTAFFTRVFTDR